MMKSNLTTGRIVYVPTDPTLPLKCPLNKTDLAHGLSITWEYNKLRMIF